MSDFRAQWWHNIGKRLWSRRAAIERAGDTNPALTIDELDVVFEVVAAGEGSEEARQRLKKRNRITVNRAYNVVSEFQRRAPTSLDDAMAKEIAAAAKYSATASYVQKVFIRWQAWKTRKAPTEQQRRTERAARYYHHYEDVRTAIRKWLALIQERQPTLLKPAAIGEPVSFAFGLAWRGPEGTAVTAKLAVEEKGFYPLLCGHLAPPVVDEDFWSRVESLKKAGTGFVLAGIHLLEQVAKVSQAETGLSTATSWQHEPNVGITVEFGKTICVNALKVEQCSYAYLEFAIVYLDAGKIVTQVSEGVRLLQGEGFDPLFIERHVSTAGNWLVPLGDQRLVCDGAVGVGQATVRAIHFVLQLHGDVIAVGPLDQIRRCRQVHQRLMQEFARSPDAMAVLLLREELESMSKAVSTQLEKAGLHHEFPGRCPFCPRQLAVDTEEQTFPLSGTLA